MFVVGGFVGTRLEPLFYKGPKGFKDFMVGEYVGISGLVVG